MITQKLNKKPGHKHLQDVVDQVFGEGAAKVGRAPLNKVTAQLQSADADEFVTFLKERLERMKENTEDTTLYPKLFRTLELMAYPVVGEREYSKLAAWDILEPWSRFKYGTMILATEEELPELPILKMFADLTEEDEAGALVLVNAPWKDRKEDFGPEEFCELARRVFFVWDVEVTERITGIVIIDEDWENGSCTCHAYWNPNSVEADDENLKQALKEVVEYGDELGEFEDFSDD